MINVFVRPTQDGSAAAVIAHIAAKQKNGTVTITRCEDNEEAAKEIQNLLYYTAIAKAYNTSQPFHREIWIVGFEVPSITYEELDMFIRDIKEHIVYNCNCAKNIYINNTDYDWTLSLGYFISKLDDYEFLYNMLDDDEFEHLVSYLLLEHPYSEDIMKEDYVLNLFVEHERKRIASYI